MYQGSDTRIDYNILGTPGAGEAFLLNPQSAAANTFSQFVSDDLRYKQYEKNLLNQQRLARRQSAIENLKSFKIGEHFIADNEELQAKYQKAMEAASQVTDNGGDPFADPTVANLQQEVLADAALSKAHKDEYTAGVKLISEKPNAYRNVREWMDWYAIPLSKRKELIKKGQLAPVLEPLFTEKNLVDLVPAVKQTDSNGNRKIWGGDPISVQRQLDNIHDTKEFQFVLQDKYNGNPTIGHFGTRTKAGVLTFPTDDKYASDYADHLLQSAQEDPALFQELGIDPSKSTDLKGDLMKIIKHQNNAYGALTRNVVTASASKIEKGYEKEFANEKMNLMWANHRLAQAKEKRMAAIEGPKIEEVKYLKTLSANLMKKDNTQAVEELSALVSTKNGLVASYDDRVVVQLPIKTDKGMFWTRNSKGQLIQKQIPDLPDKPNQPDPSTLTEPKAKAKAKAAWDEYDKRVKEYNLAMDQPIEYRTVTLKKDDLTSFTRLENIYKELGLRKDNYVPEKYGDPAAIGIFDED